MSQGVPVSHLTEGDQEKILRLAAPAFLPILKLRREQSISKLIGLFHGGADLRSTTAEIAVYDTLILEFQRKITAGE